jgi:DNA-binding CsgD family transcriptional regulator
VGGGGAPRPRSAEPLIGRANDVEFFRSFVDRSAAQGGALLLSGDPGVGKTVLLDAAAAHAMAAGMRVVRAAGAEFEADMSFAALNQVLYPLLGELEQLSALHGKALRVALGLSDGSPADPLVVSNAALALLLQAAAARPVLVIVDDLPWVDRASAVVLGFVARRLAGSRVGFLAAYRSGEESFFERSGLPGYELEPLDETAAAALIADRFPALAPRVCQRLLADAQGNPLALLELPVALSGPQRAGALPAVLPLSQRLQSLFASRVSGLPAATRELLLLAVLDGTGDLGVLGGAASGEGGIGDLAPAERARLVQVDHGTGRLVFRHPLTRSAVVELSTSDQRRRVHAVLAEQLADRPERRAWHLAEATIGPDEEVASLLEESARRVLRRGDAVAAIAGLLRAAEISPAAVDRGRRMAEATYLGANFLGDLRNAPELLDAVRENDPEHAGSLAGAMAGAYHLLNGVGDVDTAHRLLVGAIETLADPTDANDEVLVEAIYNLLEICFFGGRAELWEPFDRAVGRLKPRPPDFLALLAKTVVDPARQAAPALGHLDEVTARLGHEASPAHLVRIAVASSYVERLPQCRSALWRVVQDGRDGGAIAFSIQALALLGFDAFLTGQWDELERLADEAVQLCDSHRYALLRWPSRSLQALLAAVRGDSEATSAITDEILRWAVPRRAKAIQAYALHARALDSLGGGDFEGAYQDVCEISPAGTLASHVPHAMWVVMDLVEAAVRTGRHDEAVAHVEAAREANLGAISSRLALITEGSAGIAAIELDGSFEKALAVSDVELWPFDLARVELAYGERLRRDKATREARTHLTSALSTFQRLGAQPWTRRAGEELRATGVSLGQAYGLGPQSLTPQEREIAQLAAAGLTNKQIAERLFLSHRTVGSHLYQLFPKLGVTSRAALRDALTALPTDKSPGDEQGPSPER